MPIRYNGNEYDYDGDVYVGDNPVFKRPRRGVPITYWRHWYRSAVSNTDAIDLSIAVRKRPKEQDKVYIAYVSAANVLTVMSAIITARAEGMTWTTELTQTGCVFCSLAFDGDFMLDPDNPTTRVIFKTDDLPWLFYSTTSGQLMASVLGSPATSLAGANVTAMDAVRGVADAYKMEDQGLSVFFVVSGRLYVRSLISGAWEDQTLIGTAPENIVAIRACRTFDWRVALHVTDSDGVLYEIFSRMESSGWNRTEFIELSDISAESSFMGLFYFDFAEWEHLEVSDVSGDAWNYATYAPTLLSARNAPTEVEDPENPGQYIDNYGLVVILKFDQIIVNADLFPGDFKLTDSDSAVWYGQSAVISGQYVTVVFTDFNNAVNPITASVVTGNLSNGYMDLEETSVAFNADGLVPTYTDPPVPVEIWNSGNGYILIRFDLAIKTIVSEEGFTITGQEPFNVPGDVLVETEYTINDVGRYDINILEDAILQAGSHDGTMYAEGSLKLSAPVYVADVEKGNGTAASFSATFPTNVAGDLLVVLVERGGNYAVDTPAGWTQFLYRADSGMRMYGFYKVSTGGEESQTFTLSSDKYAWIATVWKSMDVPGPVAYAASTADPPSCTSGYDEGTETMWIGIYGWFRNGYSYSLTGYPSNCADNRNTIGVQPGIAMASMVNSDASGNPNTFSGGRASSGHTATVAFKSTAARRLTGSFVSSPVDISSYPDKVSLHATVAEPDGSSVALHVAVNEDDTQVPVVWDELTLDESMSLPSEKTGKFLWVKVDMERDSVDVVPSVSDFVIKEYDEAILQITLASSNRMRYPQGDVNVQFTGNLLGPGDVAVEAFNQDFTPADLTIMFNPHDVERIDLSIAAVSLIKEIYYSFYRSDDESIELENISAVSALYHVDDIKT